MEYNYSTASLRELIIHHIGSRYFEEGCKLSKVAKKNFNTTVQSQLTNYFLSPFKNLELYQFTHEVDLSFNVCNRLVAEVFHNRKLFEENSKELSKFLYEQSEHPNIKSGELYIAYISDCIIDDEIVDCITIFKSERKETFIQLVDVDGSLEVDTRDGLSLSKVDKACVIFNSNKSNGFKINVIDNIQKSVESKYWIDAFLKVSQSKDEFYLTKNIMGLASSFIASQLETEFEITKAEKASYINRTVDYFKKNEQFDEESFKSSVFIHDNVKQSYDAFKSNYQESNSIEISDSFALSKSAFKKELKKFKSIITLDQNVDIHIHGDNNIIEKGFDKVRGKFFYKIYFDEEN